MPSILARKLFIVSSITLFIYGCGDGSSGNTDSNVSNPPTNSSNVTISGTVVGPDGQTPLVNATVFIPQEPSEASTLSTNVVVASNAIASECSAPDEAFSSFVCTDNEGNFTIENSNFSGELRAFKGVFSTSLEVSETDNSRSIDIGSVEVNVNNNGNTTIAVVTGQFDSMEDLLAKSGLGELSDDGRLVLGTEDFQLYDGDASLNDTYPEFSQLLNDRGDGLPELHNYEIVLINCGAFEFTDIHGLDPIDNQTQSAFRTYVESGGRLFITDLAYDYIEQSFPEIVDFFGSEFTPPNEAEEHNAAERGIADIQVPMANTLNDNLTAFLSNLECMNNQPCLNEDGTIHIEGFLQGWAIMDELHNDANAEFLVEGHVQLGFNDTQLKPLTVTMDIGEGNIFYSSYHTEDLGSVEFLPQERVLQFLLFE